MTIADGVTLGVRPATMYRREISEIGVAPDIRLDPVADIHFGMNSFNRKIEKILDMASPRDRELIHAGPRVIDIKRRGGRMAEDDWDIAHGESVSIPQLGVTRQVFEDFNNQIQIKSGGKRYPSGAKFGGQSVAGQKKDIRKGPTRKDSFLARLTNLGRAGQKPRSNIRLPTAAEIYTSTWMEWVSCRAYSKKPVITVTM